MKALSYTLAAAAFVAAIGMSGFANARDGNFDRDAWLATVRSGVTVPAPIVTEGRNATESTPATVLGVEPYIARQIELDRRSHR